MVPFAVSDFLKRADRVGEARDLTWFARKNLSHEKWLREESLHATAPVTNEFVFFGQFVSAQNRNDILKFTVTLKWALHAASDLVVTLTDVLRIQNPA